MQTTDNVAKFGFYKNGYFQECMAEIKKILLACIYMLCGTFYSYGTPGAEVLSSLSTIEQGITSRFPASLWFYYRSPGYAQPDSALSVNNIVLAHIRLRQYKDHIMQSLLNSGKLQYDKGAFNQSIFYYKQVLKYCNVYDAQWAFQGYSGLGKCYTIQGDYQEAARNFYQAISIAENASGLSIKQANTYTNLSVVWNLLGEEQKSLSYLDKAEQFALREKDSAALGNIINKRGNIYLSIDMAAAYSMYLKALNISKACNDYSTAMMSTANLAYVHILNGKFDEARIWLDRFHKMYQHADIDPYHKMSMQYTYGLYTYLLHDFKLAEEIWLSAILQARLSNAPLYVVKPLKSLSQLYAQTGRFGKAYYYQQQHDSVHAGIINEEKLSAVHLLEHKYQLARKEKALALKQLKVAEQKAAIMKQNILIVTGSIAAIMLIILYLMIRKNNSRKLIMQQERNLAHSKQKELELIKTVMEGEEKERKRVALELHDGIGSMLSMAKLNLSMVRDQYTGNQGGESFNEVLHLIDQSSTAVRNTAHNLMPEILLQGGLDEGLQLFCTKLSKTQNLIVDYQCYGQPVLMDEAKEKMLFRILQEVMQMVREQSRPGSMLLQLNWQVDLLYVTIESDGSCWNTDDMERIQLRNWQILQKRIEAADGMLYLENMVSRNTTFDLEFRLQ
jgi:two-component system NarL family sensor kinase